MSAKADFATSMGLHEMSADDLLSTARVAEAAERYEDMCAAMKALCMKKSKMDPPKELEVEERNLLSVAYKNVAGTMRSSWRNVAQACSKDTQLEQDLVKKFSAKIEKELHGICDEVGTLLDELIKSSKEENETKVFYLKMKGDYFRYKCEISDKDHADYEQIKTDTRKAYEEAVKIADSALPETHPTRLGLALNFSVCYYEILKDQEKACDCAKKAFDAAIEKLDTLNDASYKDSTLIMQLLRDNLTLWTSETQQAAGGDEAEQPAS